MKVILLDIEGTTTPVDFVYGTLFPYARKMLQSKTAAEFDSDDLLRVYAEFNDDTDAAKPSGAEGPVAYLLWLMDCDRKSTALKSIQGKIWKAGYEDGSLKSMLFPDVVPAIRSWRADGKRVYIYSSGSVLAQRLLFAHTHEGDLTPLIDNYFDTEIGPKKELSSYARISDALQVTPSEILFVSDSAEECRAAHAAGCLVRFSVRPGNKAEQSEFQAIHSLQEIAI